MDNDLLAFLALVLAFFAFLFVSGHRYAHPHAHPQGHPQTYLQQAHLQQGRPEGQVHYCGPFHLELSANPHVNASPCFKCDIYRKIAKIALLLKNWPEDLVQERNRLYDELAVLVRSL